LAKEPYSILRTAPGLYLLLLLLLIMVMLHFVDTLQSYT